jgi:predicted enzyme involved in methoxymalonyl-ACP biosynthesis
MAQIQETKLRKQVSRAEQEARVAEAAHIALKVKTDQAMQIAQAQEITLHARVSQAEDQKRVAQATLKSNQDQATHDKRKSNQHVARLQAETVALQAETVALQEKAVADAVISGYYRRSMHKLSESARAYRQAQ